MARRAPCGVAHGPGAGASRVISIIVRQKPRRSKNRWAVAFRSAVQSITRGTPRATRLRSRPGGRRACARHAAHHAPQRDARLRDPLTLGRAAGAARAPAPRHGAPAPAHPARAVAVARQTALARRACRTRAQAATVSAAATTHSSLADAAHALAPVHARHADRVPDAHIRRVRGATRQVRVLVARVGDAAVAWQARLAQPARRACACLR